MLTKNICLDNVAFDQQTGFQDPSSTFMEGIYKRWVANSILTTIHHAKNIIGSKEYMYKRSLILVYSKIQQIFDVISNYSIFFSIVPPKGFGKLSMVGWLGANYENSLFIVFYLYTEVLMLLITFSGFFFIYYIINKDNFFITEFIPYFKKLSFFRKLVLGGFTMFTAIPNKFWVNVKVHFVFVFLISGFIYVLSLAFPWVFFCYFFYIILCIESLIFGLLYVNSNIFKKYINFLIFGSGSETFAASYFAWFWGNTWQQALQKLTPVLGAAAAVEAQRQVEISKKIEYANIRTIEAARNSQTGFKTPHDEHAFHAARQVEYVKDNTIVCKAVKGLEDWVGS